MGIQKDKNYNVIVKEEGSTRIEFKKSYKGSTINRLIALLETCE